jgi:hypothetical protein
MSSECQGQQQDFECGKSSYNQPLVLAFCRYEHEQLLQHEMELSSMDYLAVSHVWGDVTTLEWYHIPGIKWEVCASALGGS